MPLPDNALDRLKAAFVSTDASQGDGAPALRLQATGNQSFSSITLSGDLNMASGTRINWASGDVTITHSANALAFAGASSGYTFDSQVTLSGGNVVLSNGNLVLPAAGNVQIGATNVVLDLSGSALRINAAGFVNGVNVAAGPLTVSTGGLTVTADGATLTQGPLAIGATNGYIELTEMTAPSGAADKARIYAVVDGGSKTDLMAIFQSGAAQTIAQEP